MNWGFFGHSTIAGQSLAGAIRARTGCVVVRRAERTAPVAGNHVTDLSAALAGSVVATRHGLPSDEAHSAQSVVATAATGLAPRKTRRVTRDAGAHDRALAVENAFVVRDAARSSQSQSLNCGEPR